MNNKTIKKEKLMCCIIVFVALMAQRREEMKLPWSKVAMCY
jgi:hypothetical protein